MADHYSDIHDDLERKAREKHVAEARSRLLGRIQSADSNDVLLMDTLWADRKDIESLINLIGKFAKWEH